MKKIFLFALAGILILSCKKSDNESEIQWTAGIEDAGLILDFELYNPEGDNIVYIDPTNTNDTEENGSIEHPFDSFEDINWQDNTTYALKRGTTIQSNSIVVEANGVTICSYGDGERPVIHSLAGEGSHALLSHYQGIDGLTVRDLEIYAPDAASSLRFLNHNTNMQVINCKLHGGGWGFRSIGTNGLLIYNTEVFNTNDDGMFIQYDQNIEIKNCYVHHVNQNWVDPSTPESEAGGDGIQFDRCNHWYVHHNKIDRMGSGNKFCFISNNADQNDGIFEHNVLRGPEFNAYAIYIGDGQDLIFRYNYIEGPSGGPLYTHSQNVQFHGNIVLNMRGPLFASQSANVYNNLFYGVTNPISGGTIASNNNIFFSSTSDINISVSNLSGSNNFYSSGTVPDGSITGDAMFTDTLNDDFHLLSGSDCIDAGVDVGLTFDFDGNVIPQGGAPDIGPYEYVGK